MSTTTPSVRRPQQARSEASLERMLEAAEELLDEGSLETMKIGELVRRADTSVGAFYARFADKAALLELVQDRFLDRAVEAVRSLEDQEPPENLEAAMRRLVVRAIALYRRRPGLLRSLSLLARLHPNTALAARSTEVNARIFTLAEQQLLRFREEIDHPRPTLAVRFGLTMVVSALREHILFGRSELSPVRVSDATLANELTLAFIGYVRIPNERRSRSYSPRGATRGKP